MKSKPIIIREGSVSVKIYTALDRNRATYTVAYSEGGKRRRKNRRCLNEAKTLAQQIAVRLANGEAEITRMKKADVESYVVCARAVKPLGVPMVSAVQDYVAAKKILGTVSAREAAEFWQRHHSGIESVSVADAIERYLSYQQSKKPRSARTTKERLSGFAEAFQCDLADVGEDMIERWLDGLRVGPQTWNGRRAAVAALFKFCQRKKLLAEGLTEAERVPKRKVPSKPVEIFTAEQMRKLLAGIDPTMVPYAVLGAFVGLRPSEAAATTWDLVNLDEGFVEVVSEHKTGCRFVPLQPVAKAWLEPFRGARMKHMEDGQLCYSGVVASRKLSLAARELGIVDEWPEDVLRHSYGSYRLSVIANKARLAEEMGNSIPVIDKHYRRPIPPARGVEWFEIFPEFVTLPSHAPNRDTLTKPLLKVVSG